MPAFIHLPLTHLRINYLTKLFLSLCYLNARWNAAVRIDYVTKLSACRTPMQPSIHLPLTDLPIYHLIRLSSSSTPMPPSIHFLLTDFHINHLPTCFLSYSNEGLIHLPLLDLRINDLAKFSPGLSYWHFPHRCQSGAKRPLVGLTRLHYAAVSVGYAHCLECYPALSQAGFYWYHPR